MTWCKTKPLFEHVFNSTKLYVIRTQYCKSHTADKYVSFVYYTTLHFILIFTWTPYGLPLCDAPNSERSRVSRLASNTRCICVFNVFKRFCYFQEVHNPRYTRRGSEEGISLRRVSKSWKDNFKSIWIVSQITVIIFKFANSTWLFFYTTVISTGFRAIKWRCRSWERGVWFLSWILSFSSHNAHEPFN